MYIQVPVATYVHTRILSTLEEASHLLPLLPLLAIFVFFIAPPYFPATPTLGGTTHRRHHHHHQAKDVFPVLDKAWKAFTASVTGNTTTAERLAGLTEKSFARPAPFEERVVAQREALKLPILPTTTIGSFPQVCLLIFIVFVHK